MAIMDREVMAILRMSYDDHWRNLLNGSKWMNHRSEGCNKHRALNLWHPPEELKEPKNE